MKEKLTVSQQKVLKTAISDINFAKSCKSAKEYYIRLHTDDLKDTIYYEEKVKSHADVYEQCNLEDFYGKLFEGTINDNIVLVIASSSTLRALEKRGYIKIIKDGKRYCDTVQLLIEEFANEKIF